MAALMLVEVLKWPRLHIRSQGTASDQSLQLPSARTDGSYAMVKKIGSDSHDLLDLHFQ
jgi:hypothetical protein